jgi:phosphatidylinositol-3,4,5-trisphosphate 3-phosphatase and dual-specificity protein phosphatase PTEN
MSYPATGFKSYYRNRLVDVKRYLDEKHPDKYYVFNVSECPYDKSNFDGRVKDFNW